MPNVNGEVIYFSIYSAWCSCPRVFLGCSVGKRSDWSAKILSSWCSLFSQLMVWMKVVSLSSFLAHILWRYILEKWLGGSLRSPHFLHHPRKHMFRTRGLVWFESVFRHSHFLQCHDFSCCFPGSGSIFSSLIGRSKRSVYSVWVSVCFFPSPWRCLYCLLDITFENCLLRSEVWLISPFSSWSVCLSRVSAISLFPPLSPSFWNLLARLYTSPILQSFSFSSPYSSIFSSSTWVYYFEVSQASLSNCSHSASTSPSMKAFHFDCSNLMK